MAAPVDQEARASMSSYHADDVGDIIRLAWWLLAPKPLGVSDGIDY